jgi:hypothetical protein
MVTGDHVLNYTNFNFVGIQVTSPTVNIASRAFLHLDIYIPGTTLPGGASIQVQVVDFGANGAAGGGDDVSGTVTFTSPTLAAGNWVSLDIPFASLTGLTTKGHFGQIIFVGNNITNFFADNIYFWNNPVTPLVAAPTPTTPAVDVISIFSDAYTNVPGTDFNPNWGQATVVSQLPIAGNNTLKYAGLNYQGIQLGSNQNVSSYRYLHLDYYSTNSSTLNVYLISPGPVEKAFSLTVPTGGATGWRSVDILLSAFAPVNLANVFQLKFDGNGDIFLDNIYFWKAPSTPLTAAPTPTRPAANVISIFSDAYTNVPGTDFNPNWGQATVVSQLPIAGNNTLKYAGLNYQGTQLGSNQNVSTYNVLHLDYYTGNSTALNIYLISPGPVERPYTLTVPTNGAWTSIDIPLSAFSPVDLLNVFQIKIDGNGDIFLDNIYFYNGGGGGGGSCPTPPPGEFIVDGGFEANAGCWELIANQAGTSSTIVSNVSNGGTNSARIKTAQGGNPAIKQTRFGVGIILPNTVYKVQFDIKSDISDPLVNGAILNVATFSEAANGSGIPAVRHNLISGEASVPSTWTTRNLTFTTANNVDGGVSLLIELVGGGSTTSGTIFIDNVSLTKQ